MDKVGQINDLDNGLLHLGAEFDRLHASWLRTQAEVDRLNGPFEEEWDRRGLSIDGNLAVFWQLRNEMGLEPAIGAEHRAAKLVDAVTEKIRKTPAGTFAGVAVKARALRFDMGLDPPKADHLQEDQDWPEQVMNQFVSEVERLASAGE
jgi:hypothetical protein